MQIVYTRPEKINSYKKQREFIDCPARYTIVDSSTKAGKTTGCIVWLFEEGLKAGAGDNCWWVAPVFPVAKIAFRRMCRYISNKELFVVNKSEMSITFPNGSVIMFKSADNPDSLYGEDVEAVVVDEATRMHEDAWFAIRSTITKTRGRVKIISNVKGTNNWVYALARKAESGEAGPDWKYFRITADDAVAAGILEQEEIDDAKLTLPSGIFLELYYCIPNQQSWNKFVYAFSEKLHVGKCSVNPMYPIYLSFDFNVNPISVCVIQHYGQRIYVPHVIKLENSNTRRLAEHVRNKFPVGVFIVTGDMSGNARKTSAEMTDYMIIKTVLNIPVTSMKQLTSNPALEDSQTLVNGVMEHYPVTIDPDNAAPLIFDCKFVETDARGKIKKTDRDDPKQQADALDGFRYWLQRFFSHFKGYVTGSQKAV